MLPLPVLLTTAQQALLRRLVAYHVAGKIKAEFTPIPVSGPPSEFVLHISGEPSFRFRRISDLDALCDAQLMSYRWNRQGTGKIYAFTKAGLRATESDFDFQTTPGFEMRLADLMALLSGGAVLPAGDGAKATIATIAADPLRRHEQVDRLSDALLTAVRPHLSWTALADFERTVRALRTAVLAGHPQTETLTSLWTWLLRSGVNALPTETWPTLLTYLNPLLLIGLARLATDPNPSSSGDIYDRPR